MKYLIDADIVAFKAASSVERPIDWGDGMWTLHAYEHEGIDYIKNYIHQVTNHLGEGEVVMYLTHTDNWRKDVLPDYKSNRKNTRKPLILKALREYIMTEMDGIMVDTMEADDLLGITATNEPDCIVVSEDKDLNTIPCHLYNPAKDERIRIVSVREADYFHMVQTLTGDAVDGYKGLPRCGIKTAEKILDGCETLTEMWDAVVKAYAKQNLNESVALTQARVARICRSDNYDFKTRKVILWTPPT